MSKQYVSCYGVEATGRIIIPGKAAPLQTQAAMALEKFRKDQDRRRQKMYKTRAKSPQLQAALCRGGPDRFRESYKRSAGSQGVVGSSADADDSLRWTQSAPAMYDTRCGRGAAAATSPQSTAAAVSLKQAGKTHSLPQLRVPTAGNPDHAPTLHAPRRHVEDTAFLTQSSDDGAAAEVADVYAEDVYLDDFAATTSSPSPSSSLIMAAAAAITVPQQHEPEPPCQPMQSDAIDNVSAEYADEFETVDIAAVTSPQLAPEGEQDVPADDDLYAENDFEDDTKVKQSTPQPPVSSNAASASASASASAAVRANGSGPIAIYPEGTEGDALELSADDEMNASSSQVMYADDDFES